MMSQSDRDKVAAIANAITTLSPHASIAVMRAILIDFRENNATPLLASGAATYLESAELSLELVAEKMGNYDTLLSCGVTPSGPVAFVELKQGESIKDAVKKAVSLYLSGIVGNNKYVRNLSPLAPSVN